ncbi:hypothetical protein Hden_1550 [Hyphomicrobium denitrificans ATCC 51888]|uniref:Uncharacterized protein n=1 Tax=Hyphomicrobium denitrificans (strain ATCC 51888 / DSM 1869 / NCIMB 11706 / TK 0415) TaxID=582899 RepID=D8JQ36_HYPDA|nr:hypothetical protein [Hyphomicrobium denitrificans]ADJ21957.1 hypothetical protein Hden_0130 [Hyphomicrobium denitrificans ATCC 51888]ADJ23362.1 hypothetical protein Hden_1550 [Hyphomicrobium denitrificans ATCC 51888]
MQTRDCYGIRAIPFCDTEFEVDGLKMMWGGEAHIETDGTIIFISREWLGEGDDRITYRVPNSHAVTDNLTDRAVKALAKVLEVDCKDEITDAVTDHAVSNLEQVWSPRSEWGTHRTLRGRVA